MPSRSSTPSRRPSGALEAEVLAVLWAHDNPLTPGDVQSELGDTLAYTTVMTTLTRLHNKGLANRSNAKRGYAYTPAFDEAELAASRMKTLLDGGGDRAAVLARFVGTLTADDEKTLSGLLRRRRK